MKQAAQGTPTNKETQSLLLALITMLGCLLDCIEVLM